MATVTPAHQQVADHRYTLNYPDHEPRTSDPHYKDFEAYRRAHVKTATCARQSYADPCAGGLELHHSHIEFAVQNEVDLHALERDYPGVGDPDAVGAWVESGSNLEFLCEKHHRGHGGVHVASASDFEAEKYVANLIS